MKFNDFNLNEQLLDSIFYMGFDDTTPIQEQAIPEILNGNDLIACAQTGTGKTAAYVLPVINYLLENDLSGTNVLIIVPTRELAIQLGQQIQGIGYMANIDAAVVYGGGSGGDWEQEQQALKKGSRIIVATPGKLISHLKMGYVNFNNITHLILDEADRMLDIGFKDDLLKIVSYVPEERQTLLFSATMPTKIRQFANKILNNPAEINISVSKPAEGVLQGAYLTYENQKTPLVNSLLKDKPEYTSILIFSSTKKKVVDIVKALQKKGYSVEGISSDLEQSERKEVVNRFKARRTRILVATDVMSRGMDIKDINLIINYDVPSDAEDYVHRVGRTARADTTGVALTFVTPDDMYKLKQIERLIENQIPKLPIPRELGEGPAWRSPASGDKKGQAGKGKDRSNPSRDKKQNRNKN
ncbi:MAG: DEAD/DEAH box helicase [Bacteroidales bacterium]|nr:DEAD/DEAH box helicase [Bacteroidales bacterium]MBS3775541.1 DEAD/DEAH box helicase [Bacteroidales bacterium]